MAQRGRPNIKTINEISLADLPRILPMLPVHEQEKLLAELDKLQELKAKQAAQDKFLGFVKEVWPTINRKSREQQRRTRKPKLRKPLMQGSVPMPILSPYGVRASP